MLLLHIDSAVTAHPSVSRRLTAQIVSAWTAAHPGTRVQYLDLAADEVLRRSDDALDCPPGQVTIEDSKRRDAARGEAVLSQFLAADVVVIGAPLHNFNIPDQLKAWIDCVAQPGRTFTYTAQGPQGLAAGKTVIVASSGAESSARKGGRSVEQQQCYLLATLGFLGINDVRFVCAEGLTMDATPDRGSWQTPVATSQAGC